MKEPLVIDTNALIRLFDGEKAMCAFERGAVVLTNDRHLLALPLLRTQALD